MTSQKDYGNASDSMLVPASLRVFRHFYVNIAPGQQKLIMPVNNPRPRDVMGDPLRPVYPPGRTDFEATCRKRRGLNIFGTMGRADAPLGPHTSPGLHCTCGFYAHYKHSEDFYGHMLWGDQFYEESSMTSHLMGFVLVRAVCEISGTTIAGSRGVRAQKMKITAMAIDWDKYRDPGRTEMSEVYYDKYDLPHRRLTTNKPTAAEYQRITDAVDGVVSLDYGVEFYEDYKVMYADHPEADLSALGIEYKPEPDYPSDSWRAWVSAAHQSLAAQQQMYQQSAVTFNKIAQDLKVIIDEAFAPKVSLVKTPKLTQFERVMLDKKNRSAPPGTGIDRRRGRLR